jgi:hypothetical protein
MVRRSPSSGHASSLPHCGKPAASRIQRVHDGRMHEVQAPEIVFEAGEGVPEVDALHFVDARTDGRLGQPVQVRRDLPAAWMILRFAETDKGRLTLQEPDMKGCRSSTSMAPRGRCARAQRDTADSFGLAGHEAHHVHGHHPGAGVRTRSSSTIASRGARSGCPDGFCWRRVTIHPNSGRCRCTNSR